MQRLTNEECKVGLVRRARREYLTAYAMVGMEVGEGKVSPADLMAHNVTEQGFHHHTTDREVMVLLVSILNQPYSSPNVACPSNRPGHRLTGRISFFRQGVIKRQRRLELWPKTSKNMCKAYSIHPTDWESPESRGFAVPLITLLLSCIRLLGVRTWKA